MREESDGQENMFEELFIDRDQAWGEFLIPYTPKWKCLKMLRSKGKQDIRNEALVMLVE